MVFRVYWDFDVFLASVGDWTNIFWTHKFLDVIGYLIVENFYSLGFVDFRIGIPQTM